jgi:hypothetical protein
MPAFDFSKYADPVRRDIFFNREIIASLLFFSCLWKEACVLFPTLDLLKEG